MKELNNRELLLLAYLEGDLDTAGKQRAEAIMAEDAAFMHEYRQLAGMRLEPETIIYRDKNKLKRTAAPVKKPALRWVIPAAAIAACLSLFILLYNPARPTDTELTGSVTPGKEITGGNNNYNEVITSPGKNEIITAPAEMEQEKYTHTPAQKQETANTETMADTRVQPEMLTAKQVEINTEIPALYIATDRVYTEPIVISKPVKKGLGAWYAEAEKKVNNLLGYLQKPKININRTDEDGQQRLVISLTTDKYNVEREVGLTLK